MSIEVAGVTRFFGSTRAVWNMSMTVPAGSVTGLVGPNGAGKTTLLLMLAALLAPDDGTIRIAGLDPLTQPRQVHQAVGWMPDAFGTWDSLTCTEILMTFATAQGLDEDTGLRNAAEMLATVHLGEMARTPARVLSRGQKQRLGLARALIHRPQVLLLDEPAAGMDPRSRAELRVLLRELASSGVTVLVSSHILPELEQMVDGVVFMAGGRAVRPEGAAHDAVGPGGVPAGPGAIDGGDAAAQGDAADVGPDAAPAAPAPDPFLPQPVRRMWQIRALDAAGLAQWAAEAQIGGTAGEDGTVRIPAPDDAAAAALLRRAVEAGVEVVSFAPETGSLEATYLAMEGERR